MSPFLKTGVGNGESIFVIQPVGSTNTIDPAFKAGLIEPDWTTKTRKFPGPAKTDNAMAAPKTIRTTTNKL